MGFSPQMFGVLLWLVLTVMGLRPGKRGRNSQIGAFLVGLLYCLGPLGNVGVIDLRSYWWNPYMQPGLFMALVSGLLIAIRLWLAARSKRNKTNWPVAFDLITLLLVGIVGTALYFDRQQHAAGPIARMRSAGQTNPVDLQTLIRAVAHDYPRYRHAEGEPIDLRFAPGLCRGPGGPTGRISESGDAATHGDKLYTIYALDSAAYLRFSESKLEYDPHDSPNDPDAIQIIVKESFTPEAVNNDTHLIGQGIRPAKRDGKYYVPGARRDLFVMVNLGPKTIGSDNGWVYGTLSPDYKTVTSFGLVANCMKCHDQAPHGRLFGLPLTEDEKQYRRVDRPTTAPVASR